MHQRLPALLLVLAACGLSGGCSSLRFLTFGLGGDPGENDPLVVVRTEAGAELGVSTVHGLVFLGRGRPRGEVRLEVWFQDGPSYELATVEPVGGGLFLAEPEIRLPTTRLTFAVPEPGTEVRVAGRHGSDRWEGTARIARNARVEGLLLQPSGGLELDETQLGAAVFVGRGNERRLLGLVSGRVRLTTGGDAREYLTVAGPEVLWRLVSHGRDLTKRRRWVYREDVL